MDSNEMGYFVDFLYEKLREAEDYAASELRKAARFMGENAWMAAGKSDGARVVIEILKTAMEDYTRE